MFNLYTFSSDTHRIFLASDSWVAARRLAVKQDVFAGKAARDLHGIRLRRQCVETAGIIPAQDVYRRYPWWACKCGGADFLLIDDGTMCRCNVCGRETCVPLFDRRG